MATKTKVPEWSTPQRRQKLIDLFTASGGFCVFGHKPCDIPDHHYSLYIDDLVADWKLADREQRQAIWLAELKAMHSLGEQRFPVRGHFSAISKDIWGADQPSHYILNLGMSGLTLTPFAKVRIASEYMTLYVDLGSALRKVGKVKKRKAIRYGKPLPSRVEVIIAEIVREAVIDLQSH